MEESEFVTKYILRSAVHGPGYLWRIRRHALSLGIWSYPYTDLTSRIYRSVDRDLGTPRSAFAGHGQ